MGGIRGSSTLACGVFFLGMVRMLCGCFARHPMPDLDAIYSKEASFQHYQRNPVILIPGLM